MIAFGFGFFGLGSGTGSCTGSGSGSGSSSVSFFLSNSVWFQKPMVSRSASGFKFEILKTSPESNRLTSLVSGWFKFEI